MFGGVGLYADGIFFGIVYRGGLFFKTNTDTRKAYIERGMEAFRPNEKQTLKHYYEVPAEILEDAAALLRWAQRAIACGKNRSEKKRSSREGHPQSGRGA